MKTARLVNIDQDPKSTIVYADAQVSGTHCPFCAGPAPMITGVGFSYDGGKYDALWDLARRLSERGIEVEAV